MLCGREITERLRLLSVEIPDGDAAKQRCNRMAVAVKIDGRRGIWIRRFIRDIDLRVNAERQNFIR